jgi:hypothetical protein
MAAPFPSKNSLLYIIPHFWGIVKRTNEKGKNFSENSRKRRFMTTAGTKIFSLTKRLSR